jgi:hypothetical protein
VVEAKAAYKHPADDLQQAKEYATILSLPFAYATTGSAIIEFDFITGHEAHLVEFPTPSDLWSHYRQGRQLNDPAAANRFLAPFNLTTGKIPHYYQRIAVDLVIQATRNFADPAFDGDPAFATEEETDEHRRMTRTEIETAEEPEDGEGPVHEQVSNGGFIDSLSASTGERDGGVERGGPACCGSALVLASMSQSTFVESLRQRIPMSPAREATF